MFSDLEKRIFLVIGFVIFVMLLGIFGIGYYGAQLAQQSEERARVEEQQPAEKTGALPAEEQQEEQESSPWALYQNRERGFAFEYFKEYDENPGLSLCQIRQERENSFAMGEIGIDIVGSETLAIEAYVDRFLSTRTRAPSSWRIDSREMGTIAGGRETVHLAYRFGAQNRYAEAVFVPNGPEVFIISFAAADFACREPEVFIHLLESFEFL